MAQSAEQIFNAMLRDARNANHARAKMLKRALDSAQAELLAAQKRHASSALALKPARQLEINRAAKSVAEAKQDIVALIKKSGVKVMAPAATIRPLAPRTAIVGRPRQVASTAQLQAANQIKQQRLALVRAKQEVFDAKTPADKVQAERRLLDQAKRLAVIVPGKRKKTSALTVVSPAISKIEKAKIQKKIETLRFQISKVQASLREAQGRQPSTAILKIRLARLQTEMQAAQRRLALVSKGLVRRKPQRLSSGAIRHPRPRITLPSPDVAPSPIAVQQGLANLIPALPKKPGESAEAYRNRLEAYLQRLIARLIAMLAQGQDESTALQAATTQTLTEDSTALEAEAAAGGVAADPAAEAVEDVVEGAAGQALDTIEEQVAQSEAADTSNVDELIVQAEGAEAQLAEGSTPAEYTATTQASAEQAVAQEAAASGSDAAPAGTLWAATQQVWDEMAAQGGGVDPRLISVAAEPSADQMPPDYTLPTVEGKPLWKHPVVIGGAILAGLFLLRR